MLHDNAIPYGNIITDKESYFTQFIDWQKNGNHKNQIVEDYVIQFICHPNFEAHNKTINYYKKIDNRFEEITDIANYKKSNSYKNYKTNKGIGHMKGLFYELNLYSNIQNCSNHHTSTINGRKFERDSSHDGDFVSTKGSHW